MASFARLNGDTVAEIITVEGDASLDQLYHPDIVAACRPCAAEVREGWRWDGASFSAPGEPVVDLDAVKGDLKAAIDTAAEAERLKYITGGVGQAMTYSRKVDQAKAAQADAEPEPDDYPLLKASIGIDGEDVLAVAATILAMDAAWEQIGAAIEAARLAGKRAIDLAEDAASARAVEVVWPG